jgi:hypothetical protein
MSFESYFSLKAFTTLENFELIRWTLITVTLRSGNEISMT